ncbi:Xaa-Pro aminopeptidase [candidate division KSB1 bacterium 4484_87]|nr:MAG: Xaa-Pro aminopeptidase [candidate division KSB1 bacterium 4484_87]
MKMIKEKLEQAVEILKEKGIDVWLIFVRESHTLTDPSLPLIFEGSCTWQSAFLISATGKTTAIVGNLDFPAVRDLGVYDNVISYKASIRDDLLKEISALDPRSIALNFSTNDHVSDGLTHGMFLLLNDYLKDTDYVNRFVSAEKIISALRGRKSPSELDRLRKAINITIDIFDEVTRMLKPGLSEKEIAQFVLKRVDELGVGLSWDPASCPSVFTGPDTAGAHYGPTDRKTARGHIMNMDFGVRTDDYVSDLQRTWYFLREGETDAPAEVKKAFDAVRDAITKAAEFLRPGVEGWEVDNVARQHIINCGFDEYPHALGHQVGREAHDGAGVLCPIWERYGDLPYLKVEAGQVYTLEPRVYCKGFGVATIEEEVVVTENGCKFLSPRQMELFLVK